MKKIKHIILKKLHPEYYLLKKENESLKKDIFNLVSNESFFNKEITFKKWQIIFSTEKAFWQ